MNKPAKIEAAKEPDNLRVWNALARTDPAHTKGFSRAGGFKGTAVKPIWTVKRLTELFGPCGIGWGFEHPQFQLVNAGDETLVYCTATAWYVEEGKQHFVYGVGGDKVAVKRQSGMFCDDEAFKKAFTDAIGNAFKFIGVAADVHMGLFEDSKYLAEVREEFAANDAAEQRQKVPGISGIKKRLGDLMRAGNASDNLEAFNALVSNCKDDLTAIRDANHEYWTGDGADSEGFKAWIKRRREELAPQPEQSLSLQMLLSVLASCDSRNDLNALLDEHGAVAEALDGEESRKWELQFNEREAALLAIANVGAG